MKINLSDEPTNSNSHFGAAPDAGAYQDSATAAPDAGGSRSGPEPESRARDWPVYLPFDLDKRQIWRKRRVIYAWLPILDQLHLIATDLAILGVMVDEDTSELIIMSDDGRLPNRLSKAMLRAFVQKTSVFVAEKEKKGDPGCLVELPIASVVLDAFVERRHFPELRTFKGVRKAAFIGRDSGIVSNPGYDVGSGIVLTIEKPIELPKAPTREDAQREVSFLLDEVFCDFPIDDVGRAVIIAAIFSIAGRQATGPSPFFLFDSHTPGAGKTLVAEICATIALGQPVVAVAYRRDPAEFSKTLLSKLLLKDPVVVFDNISDGWGSPELDAMATARSGKMMVRLLGELKAVELWCESVVLGSGNGIRLAGDQARRVLWCRLDPQEEAPETRKGFRQKKLFAFVEANLERLHRAMLIAWKAYQIAGRPPSDKPLLGSFEGWSEQVRDLVIWLGLPDPVLSREQFKERDPDRDFRATLIDVLGRLDPQGHGLFASEIATAAMHTKNADLAEALKDFRNGNSINTKGLGKKLAQVRGRFIGDRKIASIRRNGQLAWTVEKKHAEATS